MITFSLERWITFLNKANVYRSGNLPKELAKVVKIKKASKTLTTMYFTEKECIFYEGQQKLYLDNQSFLQSEKEKLRELGLKEGLEEGKQKELKEAKIEVAKKLRNLNLSIQNITDATGLSQEEIEKL